MADTPDDRYEVLGALGSGGQGTTMRARDRQQNRIVALKFRPVPPDADRAAVLRETRVLLGTPPHPNIALARDHFLAGDSHVLVMDFVDGRSLGEIVADPARAPDAEVVGWVRDVADALTHLHAQSPPVVHGDVKPSNVIVRARDGRAVLVDFGLATHGFEGRAAASHGYTSPEPPSVALAPPADVYGLAATAYALLTGGPPYPGSGSTLSPAARAALSAGLATDPASRPAARAFADALAGALGVRVPSPVPRAGARPKLLGAAALAAVCLVIATAVAARPGRTPPAPRAATTTSTAGVTATTLIERAAPLDSPSTVRSEPRRIAPVAATPTSVLARTVLFDASPQLRCVQIDTAGATTAQTGGASGGDNWTLGTHVSPGWLLFYRRSDGLNRLVNVNADCTTELGRSNPTIGPNWTHVVGLADGLVFFYRQSDGGTSSHRYGERGRLADQDGYAASRDLVGFDQVAHAGAHRVVLYASRTGRATLLEIGEFGSLRVAGSTTLPTGWTTVASVGQGRIIGVDSRGDATIVHADGSGLRRIGVQALGLPPVTRSALGANGTLLHDPTSGRGVVVRQDAAGVVAVAASFALPPGFAVASSD